MRRSRWSRASKGRAAQLSAPQLDACTAVSQARHPAFFHALKAEVTDKIAGSGGDGSGTCVSAIWSINHGFMNALMLMIDSNIPP